MDRLVTQIALHGAAVLTVSLGAGLFTYRAILQDDRVAAWHLAHAGGSARGVMLMALAAMAYLPKLPTWEFAAVAWLFIFFSWTSLLAMIIAAATGERGLAFRGAPANRLVFALYLVGGVAVFPASIALVLGLVRAL